MSFLTAKNITLRIYPAQQSPNVSEAGSVQNWFVAIGKKLTFKIALSFDYRGGLFEKNLDIIIRGVQYFSASDQDGIRIIFCFAGMAFEGMNTQILHVIEFYLAGETLLTKPLDPNMFGQLFV